MKPLPPGRRIDMHALSKDARFILDRMEPDRRYQPADLRAFLPHVGAERLREVMHELWVNRHVERVGHSAWQRYRSAPANHESVDARPDATAVKPEELFDHATFSDFFK